MSRRLCIALVLACATVACAQQETKPEAPVKKAKEAELLGSRDGGGPSVDPLGAPLPGDFDAGPGALTLLLGSPQGTYMKLGDAVSRRSKGLAIQALASSGSVENLYLVGLGQADAGFVQGNILGSARYALASQWVDVLCAPFEEEVHLVTRSGTGIRSLADLKGRRVSLGGRASGTTPTARALLKAAGLDFRSDITGFRAGALDSLALLENGAIDAAFMVGGAPLPGFLAVPPQDSDEGGLELVPISGVELAQARKTTLSQDMYSWFGEPLDTLAIPCFLVVRKGLDAERRAALKALFSEPESAGGAHPKAEEFGKVSSMPAIPKVDTASIGRTVPSTLSLLSAGQGGTYDRIARGMAAVGAELGEDIAVINTQGSFRNLLLLAGGNADLAIVQRDVIECVAASQQFKPLLSEIRIASTLFREELHLVVSRGSGIKSLKDLSGKRVHTGFAASGTAFTAQAFLKAEGIEVRPDRGDTQSAIMKVLGGDLDAVFVVGGAPVALLEALPESYQEDLALVALQSNRIGRSALAEGTYRFAPGATELPATEAVLLARKEVPKDRLQRLLVALAAQRKNLIGAHPKWKEFDPSLAAADLGLPLHPCVAAVKAAAKLDSAPERSWTLGSDDGPADPGSGDAAEEAGGVEDEGDEPR